MPRADYGVGWLCAAHPLVIGVYRTCYSSLTISPGSSVVEHYSFRCLPEKSPSSIIGSDGPLSNPTPAFQPDRGERVFMPEDSRRWIVDGATANTTAAFLIVTTDPEQTR